MAMQARIWKRLTDTLRPLYLDVINESHQHNVPPNSETHFRVVVVSEMFNGRRILQRHQLVNDYLKEEMSCIHALSIQAKTPRQWSEMGNEFQADVSPRCLGGMKRDMAKIDCGPNE
eukprot:TRINITY_DN4815_c0_g1_i2.p3 TRINITY_DN4815_c0_g1~~TRINITY_DN4815_c0_g1_i2.p3  ORF type:complete len:117 (-),score=19.75 TRINITY_DN4815_c0_g1_i2:673-1023(-)